MCKLRVTESEENEIGSFIAGKSSVQRRPELRIFSNCSKYCMEEQGLFGRISTASCSGRLIWPGGIQRKETVVRWMIECIDRSPFYGFDGRPAFPFGIRGHNHEFCSLPCT